ncbi:hypothetical protein MNB_SV-6-308 [hydrothermal vent metagenome]|uniref:Uncharacterized protein n=1 Tax=hydrothermal vent metagenome TaxID=652676 RepID=A0A1W1CFM6_9ZZZZ
MFRNDDTTSKQFIEKFKELKLKLEKYEKLHLDMGYYRELEEYINRLYDSVIMKDLLDDKKFNDIREAEMSNLNRLQKLKNSSSYKKNKHKKSNNREFFD